MVEAPRRKLSVFMRSVKLNHCNASLAGANAGSVMIDPDNFDPASFAPMLNSVAHNGWLGLEYLGHGDDWVELTLPWRPDLVGDEIGKSGGDVLASGPIISLLDMSSGLAIWTKQKAFVPFATLDLRVDYTRPAKPKTNVIGHARCYRMTRSAAFVRGYAHDGDPKDTLAQFQAVFMRIAVGNKARAKAEKPASGAA